MEGIGIRVEAFISFSSTAPRPSRKSARSSSASASGQRCRARRLSMPNPSRECVSFLAVHLLISPLSVLTRPNFSAAVACEFDQRPKRRTSSFYSSLWAAWPHIRVRSYANMAEVNSFDVAERTAPAVSTSRILSRGLLARSLKACDMQLRRRSIFRK